MEETWYMADGSFIIKVTVTSESKQHVLIKGESRRRRKHSTGVYFAKTFDEAKRFLIGHLLVLREKHKRQLDLYDYQLKKIQEATDD